MSNRLLRLISRTADLKARRAQRPRRSIPIFPPDPDQDTLNPVTGFGSTPEIVDQQAFPLIVQEVSGTLVRITAANWVSDWSADAPRDGMTTLGKPTPTLSDDLGFPPGVNVTFTS
jgi:hypothetical protein